MGGGEGKEVAGREGRRRGFERLRDRKEQVEIETGRTKKRKTNTKEREKKRQVGRN